MTIHCCAVNPGVRRWQKTKGIKALKALVWHLSREPMKEMSSLKKINKQ